ncbi:uroporphyrinogen decarboxylase family protein [Geosporobacter ferrireducens]|uniref:Uncharacterized protein n=1 Tax=Geosporobacter ferrireducens TaxID=1424294 RepID=A0A1D8GK31_9FIRM|nr:uroporphyrinogen decarboxylase family protein [Geosporobacter ferrireducens]AOT71268.1 hypothetical protein Gferi_17930 [Geosporobacter ferrireducens]MTI58081.1 hypothetical protein [Geosporobacter ferrireducens]
MKIPFDVTFHPSWWYKHAGVSFKREFFTDPEYRIEADIQMRKVLHEKFGDFGLGEKKPQPRPLLGSDLIASGFLHSEIMGCEVRYQEENPPEVICTNLSDEAVMNLRLPELEKIELWKNIEEQGKYLYEKFGFVETHMNLMGIQNIAMDLRGQNLLMDYYLNPELAHHLLGLCTQLSIAIGRWFKRYSNNLSAGVTAIVKQTVPDMYLTSNCTVEMISLDTYNTFLAEYDQLLAEAFGSFGIHHCGQTMEHVVEGYKNIKNLKFAEVGAFSDIGYVRKHLPDIHLNLRYSPVKLKDVQGDELYQEIHRMIELGKPFNLLSISCVGIDSLVKDEQVRNFLSCCKNISPLV